MGATLGEIEELLHGVPPGVWNFYQYQMEATRYHHRDQMLSMLCSTPSDLSLHFYPAVQSLYFWARRKTRELRYAFTPEGAHGAFPDTDAILKL